PHYPPSLDPLAPARPGSSEKLGALVYAGASREDWYSDEAPPRGLVSCSCRPARLRIRVGRIRRSGRGRSRRSSRGLDDRLSTGRDGVPPCAECGHTLTVGLAGFRV